jgi:hypothetical protein
MRLVDDPFLAVRHRYDAAALEAVVAGHGAGLAAPAETPVFAGIVPVAVALARLIRPTLGRPAARRGVVAFAPPTLCAAASNG